MIPLVISRADLMVIHCRMPRSRFHAAADFLSVGYILRILRTSDPHPIDAQYVLGLAVCMCSLRASEA